MLAKKLRPLNKKDIYWVERNVPWFVGYKDKGRVTCMRCGSTFNENGGTEQRCPHCRQLLHIESSRRHNFDNTECFLLADSVGDWQVLRYFHVITQSRKRGKQVSIAIYEVFQRWIDSQGHYQRRSILLSMWGFVYGTEMLLRTPPRNDTYSLWDKSSYKELRIRRLIPRLRYVPYQEDIFGSFFIYCESVIKEPFIETLFKSGHKKLVRLLCINSRYNDKTWVNSVKIALRHNFNIEAHFQEWLDYMFLLRRLGEDTTNPIIICPQDLNAAERKYNALLEKKYAREADERRKRERQKRIEEDKQLNEAYKKRLGLMAGFSLTQENISLHVLRDVGEFYEEGKELHHCVYECEYYNANEHPYSLILDASVDGKRTETIEIDTREFTISQVRGACNQDSPYHEQIVAMLKNNMKKIKDAYDEII